MIETVAQRGYDRTTIERVLSVAEIPAPVFDEHFEDKQDCFLQALDELVDRLEQQLLDSRALSRRPGPSGSSWACGRCSPSWPSIPTARAWRWSSASARATRPSPACARPLARLVPILDEGRAYAAEEGSTGGRAAAAADLRGRGRRHRLDRAPAGAGRAHRRTAGCCSPTSSTSRCCPTSATKRAVRRRAGLAA